MNTSQLLMCLTLALVTILNLPIDVYGKSIPHADTILVFSPHPDDDVLGCGGTLAKHIHEKSRIIIVYVTSGEAAYHPDGPQTLALLREEEAQKAATILGINECVFLREADGNLQNSLDTVQKIAELIRQYEPNLIYIPHCQDGHNDHQVTHYLVVDAIRLLKKSLPHHPLVLGYEVWTPIQNITHVSNISHEIRQKLYALSAHASQIIYFDYVQAIEALNKYHGIMHGTCHYAECFEEISIDSPEI